MSVAQSGEIGKLHIYRPLVRPVGVFILCNKSDIAKGGHMAVWHEIEARKSIITLISADRRSELKLRHSKIERGKYEVFFRTNRNPNTPKGDWVELWPKSPIVLRNLEEAKLKSQYYFSLLEDKTKIDVLFETHIDDNKNIINIIKILHHPLYIAQAVINQRAEHRYEVRYYGDFVGSNEAGWRLTVPGVQGVDRLRGYSVATYADNLTDAEQIGWYELDKVVLENESLKMRTEDRNSSDQP